MGLLPSIWREAGCRRQIGPQASIPSRTWTANRSNSAADTFRGLARTTRSTRFGLVTRRMTFSAARATTSPTSAKYRMLCATYSPCGVRRVQIEPNVGEERFAEHVAAFVRLHHRDSLFTGLEVQAQHQPVIEFIRLATFPLSAEQTTGQHGRMTSYGRLAGSPTLRGIPWARGRNCIVGRDRRRMLQSAHAGAMRR